MGRLEQVAERRDRGLAGVAEAVGEAVRRAMKRAGTKSAEVAIAISGDAAITKIIQMPSNLNENDLEAQVEIQADQYIPL